MGRPPPPSPEAGGAGAGGAGAGAGGAGAGAGAGARGCGASGAGGVAGTSGTAGTSGVGGVGGTSGVGGTAGGCGTGGTWRFLNAEGALFSTGRISSTPSAKHMARLTGQGACLAIFLPRLPRPSRSRLRKNPRFSAGGTAGAASLSDAAKATIAKAMGQSFIIGLTMLKSLTAIDNRVLL